MDTAVDKPTTNPLIVVAFVALLAAAGAVYQLFVQPHLNPLHIVRLVAFVVFLALYVAGSRFAWHVAVIAALVITPAYVLVPQIQHHAVRPATVPVLLFLSLVCLVYLWRLRRPYFTFVQRANTASI
jgi:hypothetical protein